MAETASEAPEPASSVPEAEPSSSILERTSSSVSLVSSQADDDAKTEVIDDEEWGETSSVVSQSMTSVTSPLEGMSFEHNEPASSSTPRIIRTQPPEPSSSRKREYAFSDDEDSMSMTSSVSMTLSPKRPRLRRHPSNMSFEFSMRLRESTTGTRSRRSYTPRDDPRPFVGPRPTRARGLSRNSSFSDLSAILPPPSDLDVFRSESLEIMRKYSEAGTRQSSRASSPVPRESSAKFHMRGKMVIDFSVSDTSSHPAPAHPNTITNGNANSSHLTYACPVSWSHTNVLAFSRGNRVNMRSFQFGTSDETVQFCKIAKDAGDLRLLSWAGPEKPDTLAAVTALGTVQIWDVNSKKKTASWRISSGVTSLAWYGNVLTMAGTKGLVRQYDSRVNPKKLLKVIPKGGPNWAPVRALAFNNDGTKLASGDDSGMVYIWDSRTWGKQNFGETQVHYHRRVQHAAPVRAIAWCPWKKGLFASADAGEHLSTLRIYDTEKAAEKGSLPPPPPPLRHRHSMPSLATPTDEPLYSMTYDAPVTSIQWSEIANELLMTHGPGNPPADPPVVNGVVVPPRPAKYSSSVSVWSFTTKKEIACISAGDTGISGSCMSPNRQKIILVAPEEKKLMLWDVWKPVLKRSDSKFSLTGFNGIR